MKIQLIEYNKENIFYKNKNCIKKTYINMGTFEIEFKIYVKILVAIQNILNEPYEDIEKDNMVVQGIYLLQCNLPLNIKKLIDSEKQYIIK